MRGLINLNAIPIAYENTAYFVTEKELNAVKQTKYREPDDGLYLSKSIHLLEDKALASLKAFIIKKAEEYIQNVLEIKDKIYLTQSWSTINEKGGSHKTHSHPNTFISLVYYVQCKSGSLRFHLNTNALKNCFNFSYTIKNYNIYNSSEWEVPVQTGDIVVFPGHILHGTNPNKSVEPRIIVGANFFIRGTLGSDEQISTITI